ncbi:MAG: hypothetical protein MUF49_28665 [Oculatellaceae cyanobacterium Prado106]|jgi:hypothetical protein|nr:hypothetical protein [Oculatellaceae cyanobacterium Prado106]
MQQSVEAFRKQVVYAMNILLKNRTSNNPADSFNYDPNVSNLLPVSTLGFTLTHPSELGEVSENTDACNHALP